MLVKGDNVFPTHFIDDVVNVYPFSQNKIMAKEKDLLPHG